MTVIKVTLATYRVPRDYLIMLADEFMARPLGSTKGASIEFSFDLAANADAFRKVLETTFKPRPPAKPTKGPTREEAEGGGDEEQPTGSSI